ncbi:MAG: CBS domain-containing protein [Candidatus Binatus sp.]|uniref:CBS domain-containing protein n=1 Tax=Candidatus Binatus sp. TaxID=2811406 RepID=UPI002716C576|nr:CBS domain-containing protein [Candidatus Binatus sp.]MDO8431013.1 CBS domain-containing protein [Candidatus Binatus sp.]
MKVEQLMKREVKVCTEGDTLNRAAELMWESDCGCIPVISANGDGRVIGVVTDRDIAIAAYTQGKQLWAIPVGAAMARKVITCHANDGISQAEALMRDSQVRRLPVVDQNEHLVGILSLNDIAREAQREAATGKRAEVAGESVAETLAFVCQPRSSHEVALAA